jgi:hypothetical protein
VNPAVQVTTKKGWLAGVIRITLKERGGKCFPVILASTSVNLKENVVGVKEACKTVTFTQADSNDKVIFTSHLYHGKVNFLAQNATPLRLPPWPSVRGSLTIL